MKTIASVLIGSLLAATTSLAAAQGSAGKIGARAQPPAPPAPTPIASPVLPGAPSASGLASPFPPSVPALAVPGTSATGTMAPGAPVTDDLAGLAPDTTVMGAGAYGTRGLTRTAAPGPVTDVDIARSFLGADGNRDGLLSRAEAMRLTIMPFAFEEMDANHDDILTRSEYEEAVR